MTNSDQRKQELRQAIMVNVQANGLHVPGDFWFFLIFRTEAQLKSIAKEMHVTFANHS